VNGATLCVGMRRAEIDRKFDEIVAFTETCAKLVAAARMRGWHLW